MTDLLLPFDAPEAARQEGRTTPENLVKREMDRLDRNALRVLERLKRGPATNVELCKPDLGGLNAVRSRIPALRTQGWVITAKRLKDGVFTYTLMGLKGQENAVKSA